MPQKRPLFSLYLHLQTLTPNPQPVHHRPTPGTTQPRPLCQNQQCTTKQPVHSTTCTLYKGLCPSSGPFLLSTPLPATPWSLSVTCDPSPIPTFPFFLSGQPPRHAGGRQPRHRVGAEQRPPVRGGPLHSLHHRAVCRGAAGELGHVCTGKRKGVWGWGSDRINLGRESDKTAVNSGSCCIKTKSTERFQPWEPTGRPLPQSGATRRSARKCASPVRQVKLDARVLPILGHC